MTVASLAIADLSAAYRERRTTPREVLQALYDRIDSLGHLNIWISRLSRQQALERAQALTDADRSLPLYGVPFAIKDNIDLEGLATTAGCPAFAYAPSQSAFVVQRLIAAGAIPIGKTNLDQFATGLVGTRSPYGVCRNSFNPDYISGGSSSGSALAVALGVASFALGTDTAGSGRIPAAFNNLVGLKPTCGRLSPRGVVPACRSVDAVSILSVNAEDAARVCRVAEGFDAAEPYSRRIATAPPASLPGRAFRFGVPHPEQLQFFGNEEYPRLFDAAIARLQSLGGQRVLVDFEPFLEAARLLYEGPWVAERYLTIEPLLRSMPDAILPVTRQVIAAGAGASALDAFRAHYRLQALRRVAENILQPIDLLVTPTAGTIYRVEQVIADPIRLNAQLGFYTNFVNLLDLAAVAVPAGFSSQSLPFGITLVGAAWSDYALLRLAARLQAAEPGRQGALDHPLPTESAFDWDVATERIAFAVCGAHMEGLPLNHQLRKLGAVLLERTSTAPQYRLYALPGGPPYRPGLTRVERDGAAIELEVWSVPEAALGGFIDQIPAPLGVGRVQLGSGTAVCGFLCEGHALGQALDITHHGGWRAYLASRA
jgi:allophanate hydrolase